MHSLLESAEGSCRDIKRAESAESAEHDETVIYMRSLTQTALGEEHVHLSYERHQGAVPRSQVSVPSLLPSRRPTAFSYRCCVGEDLSSSRSDRRVSAR